MAEIKIVAFAGSTRRESFNKKLIKVAVDAARAAGADVELIDLRDFPLPLYDGDLEAEQGIPENAMKLKKLFIASHGFLISAPEYNSSITAVLKNTIDWVSRPVKDEKPLEAFQGKVAGLMSASPGALGGLRGLVHVRSILENIGTMCLPEQLAVSTAGEAFSPEGKLKDEKRHATVQRIAARLVDVLRKLHA